MPSHQIVNILNETEINIEGKNKRIHNDTKKQLRKKERINKDAKNKEQKEERNKDQRLSGNRIYIRGCIKSSQT
jgi:hypothetical protein